MDQDLSIEKKIAKFEFSVLMSVYHKETPDNLKSCLESILINQTVKPTETVIVIDGEIGSMLRELIHEFCYRFDKIKILQLPKQAGLGNALKEGLLKCKYDWVARMDTDDIAHPNRFYLQIDYLINHPDVDILGGYIEEFICEVGDRQVIKKVPITNDEIKQYSVIRNPINHPTVFFKREKILDIGSYVEVTLFEDFYLWIRSIKHNYHLANIPKVLVFFRVGQNALNRRHGFKYLQKEIKFFYLLKQEHLINYFQFLFVLLVRIPWRILPLRLLKLFYKFFLR